MGRITRILWWLMGGGAVTGGGWRPGREQNSSSCWPLGQRLQRREAWGGRGVGRNVVGYEWRWEKFTLRAQKVNLTKCVQQVFGKGDLMLMFCPGFRTARRDAAHAGETALLAKRACCWVTAYPPLVPSPPPGARSRCAGSSHRRKNLNCVRYGCPSRRDTPSQTHQALATSHLSCSVPSL